MSINDINLLIAMLKAETNQEKARAVMAWLKATEGREG